jgi:uncharacterized peroxidase-related enzyme
VRAMSFLGDPPPSEAAETAFAADRDADGYVANHTRLWMWRPQLRADFYALRSGVMSSSTLTEREFAVLVTATASTLGDSYCSLVWGDKLASATDEDTAAAVISGDDAPALSDRERALADWARRLVRDPNATSQADVDSLRAAGLDEGEIFDATAFIAFRLAFSTINDALGAVPDDELAQRLPTAVRAAITFGR